MGKAKNRREYSRRFSVADLSFLATEILRDDFKERIIFFVPIHENEAAQRRSFRPLRKRIEHHVFRAAFFPFLDAAKNQFSRFPIGIANDDNYLQAAFFAEQNHAVVELVRPDISHKVFCFHF